MRPSTGSLSPRLVMIDNDLIDGELAAAVSASEIGAGLGEQRIQARRPLRSQRGSRSRSIQEVPVGVKQRVVPVYENADRDAVEQRLLESPVRRLARPAGLFRESRRWPALRRDPGGGRASCWASSQTRRQFLRQFAERPAFDRAQSRRRFRFGRRRRAKRHHIGGSRRGAESRDRSACGVTSAALRPRAVSGAVAGAAAIVGAACGVRNRGSGAGMKPIGCSRRLRANWLMRSMSRQTPKPR